MGDDGLSEKKTVDSKEKSDLANIEEKEQFLQNLKKSVEDSDQNDSIKTKSLKQKSKKEAKLNNKNVKTPLEQTSNKDDNVFKRYHKLSQKEEKAKSSNDNISALIVIAYTILLLVLGFFVYRDMSKQLHILDNRVSRVEAILMKKKSVTIDDIEIYNMDKWTCIKQGDIK